MECVQVQACAHVCELLTSFNPKGFEVLTTFFITTKNEKVAVVVPFLCFSALICLLFELNDNFSQNGLVLAKQNC